MVSELRDREMEKQAQRHESLLQTEVRRNYEATDSLCKLWIKTANIIGN